MRKIQIVPFARSEEMRKYFYEYLTELSEFDPKIKFDEQGTPIYQWFDFYWTEKQRYPFYFIVENKVAGLALVRELEDRVFEVAEFYVLPEFRGSGNALWFASELVNLFEGQFSFSTRLTNLRAIKFWGKFVSKCDQCEVVDDEICRNWTIRKKDK